MTKSNRHGFTLIELLVVIAIIAILAAILFPVFARAREKARQTTCSSNQRQIVASVQMYVQDHEETFPSTASIWSDIKVDPGVLICPTLGKNTPIGYSYSNLLSGAGIGTFDDPASAVVTVDGSHAATSASGIYAATSAGQIIYNVNDLDARHSGFVITSYADGHVSPINTAPKLLSGLPTTPAPQIGTCPYTLAATMADTYVSGAPVTVTTTWSGTVSAAILDEDVSDQIQVGTISLTGSTFTTNYSTTVANSTGIVVSLYNGLKPISSSGATLVANGSQPPLLRVYRRISCAQFLGENPGNNISATGTAVSSGASTGASYVIDNSMTTSNRWRADPAATSNYVGVTFTTPTKVKGMRVVSGLSNGATYRWTNYHVMLQYTSGGTWNDVGTANQTTNQYWSYLGNQNITGIRLYGDTTIGNNPSASSGLIIDKIQLFAL